MKLFIYSYDEKSESAALLKKTLTDKGHEAIMIKHQGSTFKGGRDKLVFNWGSSDLPREVRRSNVINTEVAVHDAIDKVETFKNLRRYDVRIPTIYTNTADIPVNHYPVICRTRAKGADGAGIVIANKPEEVVDAKLYVQLIPSLNEYRVTVSHGEVIATQRKVRQRVAANRSDYDIRTTANGWGFDVDGNPPTNVKEQAIAAVKALGLDFGGVDVIWDGLRAHVLEVNTASQLTQYTANKLADSLIKKYAT